MLTNYDFRSFYRAAVLASVDIVDNVTPNDLHRPTPCAGWDLSRLLAHMTVQHRGFAAAASGDGADPARWDTATVADGVAIDPAGCVCRGGGRGPRGLRRRRRARRVLRTPRLRPGRRIPWLAGNRLPL